MPPADWTLGPLVNPGWTPNPPGRQPNQPPPPAQWGSQGFFPASTVSSPWGQPGPYVPPTPAGLDPWGVPSSYDPTALYGQEPGGAPSYQQSAGPSGYVGLDVSAPVAPPGFLAGARQGEQPGGGGGGASRPVFAGDLDQKRKETEQMARDESALLWDWLFRGAAEPKRPPPTTQPRGGGGGGGGRGPGREREARIAALMAQLAAGESDIYRRAAATGGYRGGMVPVRLGAQWRGAEPALRQWEMTAPT